MSSSSPQRALITGASSGIGAATALALAQAGINLVLVGRNQEKLAQVAAKAIALGVKAPTFSLDLADIPNVKAEITKVLDQVGPVQILINSAGIAQTAPLAEMSLEAWQAIMNLNVTSVWQITQALIPSLRSQGCGTIMNVVSIAGQQVFPNWGAYCASKFALMGLTKALAAEERQHGIRVIALCPGAVDTPIWDQGTIEGNFDRTAMLSPESVAQSILYAIQLPPQALVEELVLMPLGGAL
ncbi:SDR family oxidoreductase [Synechococcus sp. PCC 6312]|uniref:SDR family oxidoreductase n=1 Tax=Synechococcus sp. (strain ATCC 27167 / PCC 6312) TaxID=195253 RepID=UPI00029ED0B3|nr:SDR family oxidoreductase [Synechococcus sp. PCC 6312]AFY60672.1 short-chain alcohol dehydrogenase [Synechococcus sp. PCC 6312]